MFKWEKSGLLFCPQDQDTPEWMSEFAQAPATLIFDDFVRVYFSCRPPRDIKGQYVSHTGYVDLDRNELTKILRISDNPILQLGEIGNFDEFGIYPSSVIAYENHHLLYYGGWTRCESVPYNVSIGVAKSVDGGNVFERIGSGPILSHSPDEPMTVSGPKIRNFGGEFQLWYVAGKKWKVHDNRAESVFKIRMATSIDGFNWNRVSRDLIESKLEDDECQASPDVIYLDGIYHMFYSYKYSTGFRNSDRGYRMGYAYSEDMVNWVRDDSKVGIDISENGFDDESIAYPHVFELDNSIYMLYLGNEVGKEGFGMAKLVSN